jgi:dihydrofolate reductase
VDVRLRLRPADGRGDRRAHRAFERDPARADDPAAIRRLKDEVEGDLYVSGSRTLVRALLADGLVDELHLFVFPLTRGAGPRLFPEDAPATKLALSACQTYDNGVVYLAYRPLA